MNNQNISIYHDQVSFYLIMNAWINLQKKTITILQHTNSIKDKNHMIMSIYRGRNEKY